MRESGCYFHIAALLQNIRQINDCAFYMLQRGMHEFAPNLLEQVVHHAPKRTVAWLNLADAQWALHLTAAPDIYQAYMTLMIDSNRESQIPSRAKERAEEYR